MNCPGIFIATALGVLAHAAAAQEAIAQGERRSSSEAQVKAQREADRIIRKARRNLVILDYYKFEDHARRKEFGEVVESLSRLSSEDMEAVRVALEQGDSGKSKETIKRYTKVLSDLDNLIRKLEKTSKVEGPRDQAAPDHFKKDTKALAPEVKLANDQMETLEKSRNQVENFISREVKIRDELDKASHDPDFKTCSDAQHKLNADVNKLYEMINEQRQFPDVANALAVAKKSIGESATDSESRNRQTAWEKAQNVIRALRRSAGVIERGLTAASARLAVLEISDPNSDVDLECTKSELEQARIDLTKSVSLTRDKDTLALGALEFITAGDDDDFPILGQATDPVGCATYCVKLVIEHVSNHVKQPSIEEIKYAASTFFTTFPEGLVDAYHHFEYQAEIRRANNVEDLRNAIAQRQYPIIVVRSGSGVFDYHYVVAYRLKNDQVRVADPGGKGYKNWVSLSKLFAAMSLDQEYDGVRAFGSDWSAKGFTHTMVVFLGHYHPLGDLPAQVFKNGVVGLLSGRTLMDVGIAFGWIGNKLGNNPLGWLFKGVSYVVQLGAVLEQWVWEATKCILGPFARPLEDFLRSLSINLGGGGHGDDHKDDNKKPVGPQANPKHDNAQGLVESARNHFEQAMNSAPKVVQPALDAASRNLQNLQKLNADDPKFAQVLVDTLAESEKVNQILKEIMQLGKPVPDKNRARSGKNEPKTAEINKNAQTKVDGSNKMLVSVRGSRQGESPTASTNAGNQFDREHADKALDDQTVKVKKKGPDSLRSEREEFDKGRPRSTDLPEF